MVDLEKTRVNAIGQLWEQLQSAHAVMLGSPDRTRQLQPMAPHVAPEENCVWFYTRDDTELARSAEAGGMAQLCLVSKDQDYWACLDGKLEEKFCVDHIERFWSPMTAAWFDGGKDDPHLTMLRFTPNAAAIWASTTSSFKFSWEIARANIGGGAPDVGVTLHVTFPQTAM